MPAEVLGAWWRRVLASCVLSSVSFGLTVYFSTLLFHSWQPLRLVALSVWWIFLGACFSSIVSNVERFIYSSLQFITPGFTPLGLVVPEGTLVCK